MDKKYKIVVSRVYYGNGCDCCEDTEFEEYSVAEVLEDGSLAFVCFQEYFDDSSTINTGRPLTFGEITDAYQCILELHNIEVNEDWTCYD